MCPGKLQELIEENQWLQQELSEESAIRLAEEQALTNLVASIYQVENELSLEGRSSGNLRKALSKLIKQTCQSSTLSGCSSAVIKAILAIYSNQLENQLRIENPPDFLMWFDDAIDPNVREPIDRSTTSDHLSPTDLYANSFLDPCPPFLEGRMSRLGIVEEVDEEDLDLLSDDEVPVDESFQIKCLLDEMISQIEKEVDSEEQSPALESHRKSSVDSAMSSGESSTCLLPLKLCLDSNYRNVFVQADLLPSNITDEIAKLTQELQLQSSELLLAKKRIEELTYLVNLKKSAVLQDDLEAWKELVRHQKTLLVKMTSELEATQQQLVQAKRLVETTDRGVQVDLDVDMDLVPLQVREV